MRKNLVKNKRTIAALLVLFVAMLIVAMDSRMIVRQYEIDAVEVNTSVRIALVTDLHSCFYGEGQQKLISAIDAQKPDLVLLGGDIFDDQMDDTNTEIFIAGIAQKYPCYYVTGNHEYWSEKDAFAAKMLVLERYGVVVLSGDCKTIEFGGETINICGVDDPDSYMMRYDLVADAQGYINAQLGKLDTFRQQLNEVRELSDNENFTILLSHRPERFADYVSCGFDLVLCGHAHGGQWRIPGILNGLYAPDQGLFPRYAGGEYEQDGTIMLVSRGLARESTRLPRIFNRPELVIIEVK